MELACEVQTGGLRRKEGDGNGRNNIGRNGSCLTWLATS